MQPEFEHIFSLGRALLNLNAVGRLLRPWLLGALLLVPASFRAVPAAEQEAPPELPPAHMDVIYSSSLFRTVSKNDAIAALRVWVETVSRNYGFLVDCHVAVAENVGEIKRRLQEGPISIVVLDPIEYFELAGLGVLEPAFTGTRGKEDESLQYLLVTSRESGMTTISGLHCKTLVIQISSRADLGRMWIDVSLHDEGLGPLDRFFSSVRSVLTPSEAVLPVFFGRAGAGVVDRDSFEVMKEMNPQLGSRLRVLAVSPPVLNGIVCLDKRLVRYREDLRKGLRELHETPAGKQILMVFRSNRLKPVNAEELERMRTLCTKYRRISSESAAQQETHPNGRGEGL
jgi:hypothetical protein